MRTQSHAYLALRASARRLLRFIEMEITRQGGGAATIYADEFAVVGSVRVVLPGLAELHGSGLIDVERHFKRYVIGLSDRYRNIATAEQAANVSAATRVQRVLPAPTVSPAVV